MRDLYPLNSLRVALNFGGSGRIALIYTGLVCAKAGIGVYIDAGVGVDIDIDAEESSIIGLGADYY